MRKHKTSILIGILLFITLLGGIGHLALGYSLTPDDRGRDLDSSYLDMYEHYPYLEAWVDSLNSVGALKDTFIQAPDDVRLHAYYIRAAQPTPNTAVIIHGYRDNAVRMFMIGHLYSHDLAYNVLLPDLRWAGKSEGTHIQMGWLDRLDVLHWMEVANQLYGGATQMVVHGISMGAATTMMISGEELPPYVKCFVEDCGYTSVWDEFKHETKKRFGLPSFPFLNLTSLACRFKYGWTFKEATALEQVKKCHHPMLFIHGDNDDFVPTWMVYDLYEAKPDPKELWVTPGVDHANSYMLYRTEYTARVKQFIESSLKE